MRLECSAMAKRARSPKAPPFVWDGDWSKLPGTLNARHMAAIEGVQPETIWDRIQRRTMHPKPLRWWRPYRWLRDQVRAELERS